MENIIIRAENASVHFKKFDMKPVNLELPEGYIIGVQGPNGAGKTTLLRMILGDFDQMQGKIEIDGSDNRKYRTELLQKIGVISNDRTFFEMEDAIENEAHFSVFYPNWDGTEYRRMLEKQGLSSVKSIGAMSRGERIKYQLAFSSAYRPRLMVLDEPTAGLDPVFREDFLRALQDFVADYETTVLLATHLEEDLERVADYIIDVSAGACTMRETVNAAWAAEREQK